MLPAATMSVNSSSTFNDTLADDYSTLNARMYITCSMFAVKTLLLLPLSTFILFLGHQQWRQQRSFTTSSPSDLFTYHLVSMEMFVGVGFVCFLCSTQSKNFVLVTVGLLALTLPFYGELFFHTLTCVEWYLAVVHPVIYRRLRTTWGVRIRNTIIACVWLLCFGLLSLHVDLTTNHFIISVMCCLGFAIIVVSFCNLSVLCVLIRPGPGEGGGEKVDSLKRRAFITITAISSVLWLWLVGFLVVVALTQSTFLSVSVRRLLLPSAGWFNLPVSLVSPLLYLHRAGRLSCYWKKPETKD